MFPLIAGLVMAGLSGFSALASAETKRNQQRNQAAAMEQRAEQVRRQAALEQERGRLEAEKIDRQKRDIRRKFNEVQGHNRSMLAAGNVDMASGSALDVSLGNIDRFAADMGENAYERALKIWEGNEAKKNLNYQADAMDANASYMKRTAGTIGTSLLTAGMSGAMGFASGYSMFGGDFSSWFKDDSLPSQMAGTKYAWDHETPVGLLMRHPSGKKIAFAPRG